MTVVTAVSDYAGELIARSSLSLVTGSLQLSGRGILLSPKGKLQRDIGGVANGRKGQSANHSSSKSARGTIQYT